MYCDPLLLEMNRTSGIKEQTLPTKFPKCKHCKDVLIIMSLSEHPDVGKIGLQLVFVS
jgi:hypothetical protein